MLCSPSSSWEYTFTLAASVLSPLAGLCSHTSPERSVWSTRASGSTARSIGSPGVASIVTFWNCESGGGPWAAASDGQAHSASAAAPATSVAHQYLTQAR